MPQRTGPERIAGQFRRAALEAAGLAAPQPAQGRDVFTGGLMLSPETRDEVSWLQAALPGYDVLVTSHRHACRFEAVRRFDGPQAGPWCVVSSNLTDLWRELAPWTRPAAGSRAAGPRLLMSALVFIRPLARTLTLARTTARKTRPLSLLPFLVITDDDARPQRHSARSAGHHPAQRGPRL